MLCPTSKSVVRTHTGVKWSKAGLHSLTLLFNITLDYIMTKVRKNSKGIRWWLCGKLTDLIYADDVCLLTHSTQNMQIMLERTEKESTKVGLKINVQKSKEMCIAMNNKEPLVYTVKLLKEWQNLHIWGVLMITRVVQKLISWPIFVKPRQRSVHWTRSENQRHTQRKPNFTFLTLMRKPSYSTAERPGKIQKYNS